MRQLVRSSSLIAVACLIAAPLSSAFAQGRLGQPRGGRGVPHEVMDELQTIQAQLASVEDAVGVLDAGTASTGEAYAEICFNAKLGVLADGSVVVQGTNAAGVGTGVDLYGLLDIDAGIGAIGKTQLASMLRSGVDMSVKMCLNAGVLKVADAPTPSAPIAVTPPAELQDLLDATQDSLARLYGDIPTIVDDMDVGPERINDGVLAMMAAVSTPQPPATGLLNATEWDDTVTNLPGADFMSGRYLGVQDVFASMYNGDVCGYYDGISPQLDPGFATAVNNACSAVPAGIDTSIDAVSDTVDTIYTTNTTTIGTIETITTNTYGFLTNTLYPVVNVIKSVVDSIAARL